MAAAPVGSDIDQAFDIHGNLAAQVALHLQVLGIDDILDSRNIVILQVWSTRSTWGVSLTQITS